MIERPAWGGLAVEGGQPHRVASVLAELDATILVTLHDPAWWAALNWHRRIDLTAIADGA